MIRLGDQGVLNTMAKKVTPALARAVNGMGATQGVELLASYLNLLIGKGCGTGWDKGEQIAAANVLRELRAAAEPTVIDCGGNRGEWTREVRARLGTDRGRWVIIEPADECVRLCRQLPNVEVVAAAAGESPATLKLYTDAAASGLASLHERGDSFARGAHFTTREVPVITIDSIIDDKGLGRIDFMKMDIEGHELFALPGARKALEAGKIRALSFEFGAGNINSRTYFRDFWNLLTPLGYDIRRICPGGSTVAIRDYYEDLEAFRGVSNYIGVLKKTA
jgi:FkbM family methyltransferase